MNHQQDILYKLLTEKEKKIERPKKKKTKKKRKKERRDIPYIMYIKNKYLHSLKKEKRIKENIKIN